MWNYLQFFGIEIIQTELPKKYVFAYSSFIIDCRMIIGASRESIWHFMRTDIIFAYILKLYSRIFKYFACNATTKPTPSLMLAID